MEEVLRKRSNQKIILFILLMLVIPFLLIVIAGARSGNLLQIIEHLKPPVYHIEIGTDLSLYEGKKVSCSAIHIAHHVVSIYEPDDPEHKYFTKSYLVTDNDFKNPTLIFFPPSKYEQLEDMCKKTWKNMNGELEIVYPIDVEGYVYKLGESNIPFYEQAMNEIYGEGTISNATDIYFIDDEGAYIKDKVIQELKIILIAIGLTEIILFFCMLHMIVKSKQYPQIIEKFLLDNRINMYTLDKMFSETEEIVKNYWISPELTVGYDSVNYVILNNADISRITVRTIPGKRVTYELIFFNKDMEKCGKIVLVSANEILGYYGFNCPHIMVSHWSSLI